MIAVEARREAHDRDVSRALMGAILTRTQDPADLAKKLYVRKRLARRRPQTPAEAHAIVRLLAAKFGWKARPHQAIVIED